MSTCETCRFFSALSSECRRNPPLAVPIQTAPGQMTVLGVFPATKKENWCGEHKPAVAG